METQNNIAESKRLYDHFHDFSKIETEQEISNGQTKVEQTAQYVQTLLKVIIGQSEEKWLKTKILASRCNLIQKSWRFLWLILH